MRPHPRRAVAALVGVLAVALLPAIAQPPAAGVESSFEVSPGAAAPGDTVRLSGDGCDPAGAAEAVLLDEDGAAVGPFRSFVPTAEGTWGGPYSLPEDLAAGEDYRFAGRCLDGSGEVVVEYVAQPFTVDPVEPEPTPSETSSSEPSPSATKTPPTVGTGGPTPSSGESSTPTPGITGGGSTAPTPGEDGSPEPTKDPLQQKADDVVAALEDGKLAFRPPQQMREGVSEEVVIQVRRPSVPGDPTTGLPGQGPPVVVPVQVSTVMTAELTGDDFDIDPAGPQRRILTSTFPAEWRWSVTPKEFGTTTLRLQLAVELPEAPGTPLIPEVTYDEKIEVQVHPLYTATRLLRTAQGVLTATGLSAAVVATALWQLWRRRRVTAGAPVAASADGAATSAAAGSPVPPQRRRRLGRRGPRVAGPRR